MIRPAFDRSDLGCIAVVLTLGLGCIVATCIAVHFIVKWW